MLVDLVLFFIRGSSNSRNSPRNIQKHSFRKTRHMSYLVIFFLKTVIREKVELPSQGFIVLFVYLCQNFKTNTLPIFLHNLHLSPIGFQNFHKIDPKLKDSDKISRDRDSSFTKQNVLPNNTHTLIIMSLALLSCHCQILSVIDVKKE